VSIVESSDDVGAAHAKPSAWRPTSWIAAAGRRLHLQLCAAHGWAATLDGIENLSLYRIVAAALGQLLVLAKGAAKSAVKGTVARAIWASPHE
jgi:hypothetical protein